MKEIVASGRGLGYAIALLGMGIIMTSFLLAVIGPAFSDVMSAAGNHTSSSQAATGIGWTKQAMNLMPVFGLLIGSVMIIADAARETRGP